MLKHFLSHHYKRILITFAACLAILLSVIILHTQLRVAQEDHQSRKGRSWRRKAPQQPIPTKSSVMLAGKRLSDWQLYVDPYTPARRQADEWRASRPADAKSMDYMAAQPQAKWLGDWLPDPYSETRAFAKAAQAKNTLPVFVLYNLPERDCGGFSFGGANNTAAYKQWASRIASGLAQYPAMVIIEPDALAEFGECFNASQQADILKLFKDTTALLRQDQNLLIYFDAGHSRWQRASVMARRLIDAGVAQADGFSLNVSNFMRTDELTTYGADISQRIGNKHFLIDTSRNGNGSNDEWCNPTGRALGQAPTLRTGNTLTDAFMWVKIPGESDGTCDRGEPKSGVWWPAYALDLAHRAGH